MWLGLSKEHSTIRSSWLLQDCGKYAKRNEFHEHGYIATLHFCKVSSLLTNNAMWKSLIVDKASVCLITTAAAAKSLQSCPTLCDPIDGSPPGSTVSGILQARTLEWVAISFSNVPWEWYYIKDSVLVPNYWQVGHSAMAIVGLALVSGSPCCWAHM